MLILFEDGLIPKFYMYYSPSSKTVALITWKRAIFEVQLLKLWQTLCDVTEVLLVLLHLALLCLLISRHCWGV